MSALLPASPYKGLAPFGDSELDALLFFGRERDSEIVVANLLATRLTVLYGASGVGKSSLLGASVARRLREEPDAEVIVFSSWSGDAAAPLRAAQEAAEAGRETYLILDQFEEFFLYHADEEGDGTLADALPELLRRTEHRVNVLIAVREDALASLDAFKARIPNVLANYLRLSHLDRAAGRAAITGPLGRWSELAGEDERVEIEPALVDAVLDETAAGRVELGGVGVGADPAAADGGSGQIEAPILQLVMERLWRAERDAGSRTLRLETLRGLGGAAQIVRDHLEHALAELLPAQQDAAASIFDHLVTPSGSKIALRAGDLADYAGVPAGELEPVLATLGRERILRAVDNGGGGGAERYEIFHDVLADAVLAWRAERRIQRERQDAQRHHRRLLVLAVCSLAALAVVTAIAVFALTERDRARSHERQATARELEANALLGLQRGESGSLSMALDAAQREPGEQSERVLRKVLVESRLRAVLTTPPVASLQYSADGRSLLVAGGDPRVRLFDARTGGLQQSFRDPGVVTHAVFGPGGLLLSGDENGVATLRRPGALRPVQRVRGRGAVTALAFSRDGRQFLVATEGGTALVMRVGGGRVSALPQPGPVERAVFDRSGGRVATVAVERGGRQRARVYDAASGRLLYVLPQTAVQDVEFSPNGNLVATGSHDGTIGMWDASTGRPLGRLDDQALNVKDIAFSPDGTLLAAGYGDGVARVWTVATLGRLYVLHGHTGTVDAVAWSPDGRAPAAASSDQSATLHGIDTRVDKGGVLATLPGNTGGTTALAYNPSGTRIATGALDGGVRVWDALPEQVMQLLGLHRRAVQTAAYSPDGRLVVSAGDDRTARIWDVRSRRQLYVLRAPGRVSDASFSPDGNLVVTASGDGAARLWRVSDGGLVRTLPSKAPVRLARFTPDGTLVASAADDGTVSLWRVEDGVKVRDLHGGGPVVALAFSPDGRLVAGASGNTVDLWSAEDGRLVHRLRAGEGIQSVAFSPDGRLLATAELRGTVRLWDVESGRALRVLHGHKPNSRVTDVVFSRDGTRLLTTGSDNDGHVWSVPEGSEELLLRGQFGSLSTGAFSPDGRWIVTAGPTSAALWTEPSGPPVYFLRGPTDRLTDVAFSPDGMQVLAASGDGGVRTYDCEVCGDLASLEALAERRLEQPGL